MPSALLDRFGDALDQRLAPTDLRTWTERTCRLRGSPYVVPPCYQAIYASTARRLFIRKAAQTFASQFLVHAALWCCATVAGRRGNSLYVFPAERQLGDFCRGRIEPLIAESPILAGMIGDTDNTFQKAIGKGFLYLRGAQTDKGLITVDADLALLDEVARYPAGTLELVDRRLGSSYLNWERACSTPVYPSDQAGQLWDRSTQARYQVRCSHCGTWQPLEVDVNLNPESAVVECGHCRGDMTHDRLGEGHWEAEQPAGEWEGYQVNKLLSHRVDLHALAATYRAVLAGDASSAALQEFWNQDVGRSYLPKGGHLDADMLDACCSDPEYTSMPGVGANCVMGVDVGSVLHVVICEPRNGLLYLVFAGTVNAFSQLGPLFHRYAVRRCVVDAAPETHAARTFAEERPQRGRVWLATFVAQQSGNKSSLCKWDDDSRTVQVNRTMALDTVIHSVITRRMVWPYPALAARELGGNVNQAGLGALYRHLCAPIRVMALAPDGSQVARYDANGPDHYCFALLYSTVAAEQAVGEIGVPPPPPEREPDLDDPYGDTSPMDAFFRLDAYASRQMDRSYKRQSGADGGFVTGSGKRIPPTPKEWTEATNSALVPQGAAAPAQATGETQVVLSGTAPAGPRPSPGQPDDHLGPLDFSHAFGDE